MIIVRTPLRVSLFGGGTDHPSWYKNLGPGAVLSTTIDKYVYITLRDLPPIFDFNYRVAWRMVEQAVGLDEIQHPVVREVLRNYAPNPCPKYEIHYHADLPARSGLGSSSSFTVAALHALHLHLGKPLSKMALAREAIRVEQEFLREPVGSQDQTAAAFGGLNRIDFKSNGDLVVEPIDASPRRKADLEASMMMMFTGFTRDAGAIEKQKVSGFESKRAELTRLYEMVGEGQRILEDRSIPIGDVGLLLDEAWRRKRQLSTAVSNGPIDNAYMVAREAGALGGKLLGAGGGGFLLFIVPPAKRAQVKEALASVPLGEGRPATYVPIAMESGGSSVVLHDPELVWSAEVANVHKTA